jgi:hypothetical protein
MLPCEQCRACRNGVGGGEIGRSMLAIVLSLVVFVVVSLLIFLIALLLFAGIFWPAVISVFCGLAAATILNATDIMARRSGRNPTDSEAGTDGRDNQRGNGRVP